MKDKFKILLRCIMWFTLSFGLLWVIGIGMLFESIAPWRALIAFSMILTIIFEIIYQVEVVKEKQIKELQNRIEALERKG